MNEQEYVCAMRAISALMDVDPEPDTVLGKALVILSDEVEAYEREHFHFDTPTPKQLAAFRRSER